MFSIPQLITALAGGTFAFFLIPRLKKRLGEKKDKMDNLFTYSLYGVTAVLLAISYVKDRNKTMLSFKRAWKNVYQCAAAIYFGFFFWQGFLVAAVSPETIQYVIGAQSGFRGMLTAALLGAVTLVPVLVAFPCRRQAAANGAGHNRQRFYFHAHHGWVL